MIYHSQQDTVTSTISSSSLVTNYRVTRRQQDGNDKADSSRPGPGPGPRPGDDGSYEDEAKGGSADIDTHTPTRPGDNNVRPGSRARDGFVKSDSATQGSRPGDHYQRPGSRAGNVLPSPGARAGDETARLGFEPRGDHEIKVDTQEPGVRPGDYKKGARIGDETQVPGSRE